MLRLSLDRDFVSRSIRNSAWKPARVLSAERPGTEQRKGRDDYEQTR